MSFVPRIHEIYKHFKGNLYQITAIAEHTETGEVRVVYQAMYGEFKTYARPLSMFVSRVDKEKYPEVTQEFRFALQGPDADRQRRESVEEAQTLCAESQDSVTDSLGKSAPACKNQVKVETEAVAVGADETAVEELALDPLLLEFLDADSYGERLNILAALQHRITDDMITTMAIACDVEIGEGAPQERVEALRNCLLTLERYECNRLR